MRLEIEPKVTTPPFVANEAFDDMGFSPDLDALLKKGVAAAQSGERDLARKMLSQAAAIDPASEDAWMWLASISEYPEELLAFLDRVLSINPENSRAIEWRLATRSLLAKTFVRRAETALQEGSNEFAEKCLNQALTYDVNCPGAWYQLAFLSDSENEKLELLEKVLKSDPEHAEAKNAIAAIHSARSQAAFDKAKQAAVDGFHLNAIEILDEFLVDFPDSVDAWLLKSHLSQSLELKLEALEKALELDPSNAAARSGMAFLSLTFGTSQEADATEVEAVAATDEESAEPVVEFAEQPVEVSALAEVEEQVAEASPFVEVAEHAAEATPFLEVKVHAVEATPFVEVEEQAVDASPVVEVEEQVVEAAPAFEYEVEESADLDEQPTSEVADSVVDDEYATQPTVGSIELAASDVEAVSDDHVELVNVDFEEDGDYHGSQPVYVTNVEEDESYSLAQEEIVEDHSVQADPYAEPELWQEANSASPFDTKAELQTDGVACPFCSRSNDAQAFTCSSCRATLTISDIEALFDVESVDRSELQNSVTQMEADWNLREFNGSELTTLGVGHFNLGNHDAGLKYLQEATRSDPNNVIFAGQVNAIAIRLDELRRQMENNGSKPTGKTILVVDDSPTVRKLISGKLEKSGHVVVCASDGVEALERLEGGLPDLVLLDITMPRMDGYEVCKQIRSNPQAKNLPVVMISGKDGFFDKVRGRMAGSTGYVTKPFGPETLMKALETYLVPEA